MKPVKRFRINNLRHRAQRAVSDRSWNQHEVTYPYPYPYPYSLQPDWNYYYQDYHLNPTDPSSSYVPENIHPLSDTISRSEDTADEYEDSKTEEMETPYYFTEEESVTEASTTTTTTPEPFDINDIKVPTRFLRIEYMTSFVFLGLWYGLGFLVMFQSLVVPATKLVLVGVYFALTKYAGAPQWDVQDALDQLPPD